MVVRLGRRRAARVFLVLVLAAFVCQGALPFLGLPRTIWLGLIAWSFAFRAAWRLWAHTGPTSEIIPAQGWTLRSFVLLALLDAAALLWFQYW